MSQKVHVLFQIIIIFFVAQKNCNSQIFLESYE